MKGTVYALIVILAALSLCSFSTSQDTRPTRTIVSPELSGTTVVVDNDAFAWVRDVPGVPGRGAQTLTGGTSASGAGGVFEASWKHDPDGTGPRQPINCSVSYEPQANESVSNAARKFMDRVNNLMEIFPPNVGPSVGG